MSEASDLTNALKDLKDTLTVDAPQRRGSTEPRESFTPAARDESQDKKEDEVKKKSIFWLDHKYFFQYSAAEW